MRFASSGGSFGAVEIRYAGDPASSSWVVPVPREIAADGLSVDVPADALAVLDDETRPQILPHFLSASGPTLRPFPSAATKTPCCS